jgi:hypothetical protein
MTISYIFVIVCVYYSAQLRHLYSRKLSVLKEVINALAD